MAYAPTVIDLDEDIEREPLMRAELDSVSVYPVCWFLCASCTFPLIKLGL